MDQRVVITPERHLTAEAIGPQTVRAVCERFEADPAVGAVVTFTGVVRADRLPDGEVQAIEFSAAEAVAERATRELVERLAAETPGERVMIHVEHRLGRVPVGEAPIVIVAAAGHRKETFALCSGILEALKAEVPIYGKELLNGGGSAWKVNT